jgi:hypothetical protein
MSDTLSCPECETEIDSIDGLERGGEIAEIEGDDDGSISLFGNRDLFLCRNCRRPLGMPRL